MSSKKSMMDLAYDNLKGKKRPVAFAKLWEDVSKEYGASMDQISQFYSDLTLDKRFTQLKENKWDLVERRKFEESYIDISQLELGDDVPEDGEEDPDLRSDDF